MLIATIIVSTIAFVRRWRSRRSGPESAAPPRRSRREFDTRLRRLAPVLSGAAALALLGIGGGVLVQC
ncbi:hypothetical protein [Nocardia sp. XZ_19_385]|uniref:hypothetical protein n=1 Tax=Nocardia sp. XZ_19_385 TaxID=2769488 RepID=UPI00188FB745|nr:hypothetical protein [Nocardia sp. XZ_19_385]